MALTLSMLLGATTVASADTVTNNAVADGRATITAGGSTTITYTLNEQTAAEEGTGGQNGCNANGGNPVTLAISAPTGVTASATSVVLDGCGPAKAQTVAFSATSAGEYPVTHTASGRRGVTTAAGANFTLKVNPAVVTPLNTAPTLQLPENLTVEGNTTGGAHVTFTATASDAEDGAGLAADCNPASGAFFALGGPHTVSCSYTDRGGLTASGTFTVTVHDSTKPSLHTPTAVDAEATSGDGAMADWTATAADIVDADPTVHCSADPDSTFALGVTPVTCTATDASGNADSRAFNVTVSDTTAPQLQDAPADMTVEATSSNGAVVTFTTPTATDTVDTTPTVACAPASGTQFRLGATTVTCTATDASRNSSSASFVARVVDTTAPALTVPAEITAEATSAAGADVEFTVSAHDLVDANPRLRCDRSPGDTFALGSHTVSCEATDSAGNTAQGEFTVTVADTTAPVLGELADDITAEATGPDGAEVHFDVPTATDAVDAGPHVYCDAAPGSQFRLGTRIVSCVAVDAAGNRSGPRTFTVNVVDTTAPQFADVPAEAIVAEATGPSGAVVAYTAPTAHDLVDGPVPVTCSPASASTFSLGDHTVTCTAADRQGLEVEAAFPVRVVDTTAPQLSSLPGDMTVEATGPAGAPVNFTAPTASDLVDGTVAVSCSTVSGTTLPLGDTVVTCSATDAARNTASGSFTVSVVDTTAPSFAGVPADFSVVATTGPGAVVTYTPPTATDLVDGAVAVTCTPASGSTLGFGTNTVACQAQDSRGTTSHATFTVTVNPPTHTGFLAPITTNGNRSTFRANSTIPVKMGLTGTTASVTNAELSVTVRKVDPNATGGEPEAGVTAAPTSGTMMRYDPVDGHYIFNLSTKTLGTGQFEITVSVGSAVLDRTVMTIR